MKYVLSIVGPYKRVTKTTRERERERGRSDAHSTAKVILVRARHKSLKQTVRGKRNQFQVVKRERSNDRDVQRAEQGWSE